MKALHLAAYVWLGISIASIMAGAGLLIGTVLSFHNGWLVSLCAFGYAAIHGALALWMRHGARPDRTLRRAAAIPLWLLPVPLLCYWISGLGDPLEPHHRAGVWLLVAAACLAVAGACWTGSLLVPHDEGQRRTT
ncbi:hypothetical protein POF50_008620 [Streptomyces sp. SL13]|uniref:Uncharacterized protein n=1 Tax=Streptantibioticus silvisoli TaxID=2705255 RepID=A0AA90H128_9ACTN|nr:hypothetical protein [Streptantibioticus silvisoli]MDI5969406.1 hypothetical protein [Streptantibioticus silvisoli]